MNVGSIEYILEAVRDTIEQAGLCFLITITEKKEAGARLMQPFPLEDDFSVYLGAGANSDKVDEIQRHQLVTLAYQNQQENGYVSLMGSATIIKDTSLRRKYWREDFSEYWPGGPDGQEYILIHVVPYKIEVMNFERNITPEPYGLAAAVLEKEGAEWVMQEP